MIPLPVKLLVSEHQVTEDPRQLDCDLDVMVMMLMMRK